MPIPKPPGVPEDAGRRIQQFLERAATIVLEDPSLTAERWQQLSAIASDLDLTADEFRTTLDDLVTRGVLKRVETTLPKPPPLPRNRTATESRATPPPRLIPPTPPGSSNVVTPPLRPSEPAHSELPSEKEPAIGAAPGPTSLSEITAKESARASAPPAKPDHSESSRMSSDKGGGRWRVEGAPVPVPPRPTKKPHEIYLDFLRQSLTYLDKGQIALAVEQRLLQHGIRVLSLSPVYARHLLEQVVAERGLQFGPGQPLPMAGESNDGSELESWKPTDSATQLVSEHLDQPIDASSEQSISSVIQLAEPKLAGSPLAAAKTNDPSGSDYIQLERVVPLRLYLRASLERVPRGLLPLALLDKLMTAGVDLYGVDAGLVLETIRHVAGDLKVAVVTEQQAEQHVTDFVANLLENEVSLSPSQVEQVRQAGTQWGLNVSQVDAVARRVCTTKQKLRRREEITTRLALTAAGLAVLLVVIFIGYAFINARPASRPIPTDKSHSPADLAK